MSDTDEQIKQRLKEIFPSPQVASAVTDLVIHKRPRGWSRKSNATYYKEIYAKQIRDDIDKMIATGNRLVYAYAKWCNEEHGDMSPSTLYQRINQSIRYLIEQMDTPERKYDKWYETVKVERERGLGVTIEFIPGLSSQSTFAAEVVEPKAHMRVWERQLDEWLESNDTEPFVKEGLALSPDDIVSMKNKFKQLSNVMANVTSSCIKIIKLA